MTSLSNVSSSQAKTPRTTALSYLPFFMQCTHTPLSIFPLLFHLFWTLQHLSTSPPPFLPSISGICRPKALAWDLSPKVKFRGWGQIATSTRGSHAYPLHIHTLPPPASSPSTPGFVVPRPWRGISVKVKSRGGQITTSEATRCFSRISRRSFSSLHSFYTNLQLAASGTLSIHTLLFNKSPD